jgi:biofilm PGA synthesis lipoprotein PgaB
MKTSVVLVSILFFIYLLFVCVSPLGALEGGEREFTIIQGEDQYNYALFLFEQKKYRLSAAEFGKLIEFYPANPYIPDAHYKMALSYYNEGSYDEAYEQLKLFLVNFPTNRYAKEAVAKRELLTEKLASTENSVQAYSIKPSFTPDTSGGIEPDSIRAIQASLFEGDTYEEVEEEIKILKDKGYNTVILRVFHNIGDRPYPFVSAPALSGVYFNTSHAPVIEDVLGKITEIAHKYNLKIFAWMTTRYADYGVEGEEDLRCKAYYFHMRSIGNCRGLDLFNEEAVAHLERLYRDLSAYPVDGILFQDDLILRHNEGFGDAAEKLFFKETGKIINPDKLYTNAYPLANGKYKVSYSKDFWEWSYWKNRRLLHVAERLMKVARERNPNIKFAINLMYESISNPRGALAWLSQSLDEALKTGFDLYAVMAYHRQIQKELDMTYDEVISFVTAMTQNVKEKVAPSYKVLMKVQVVDWDTFENLPPEEVDDILGEILAEGGTSIALVPYVGKQNVKELFLSN